MTHPTTDHLHPPAYPAQLASTLLASLQHATSSARLFLSGCFQCEFLKTGCWRGQEEQEGTWFDCDKLQVEHPYCYVNPMAVAEANPVAAPSHPPLSQSTALPRKPHPGSPLKATPLRSPGSAFANRGLGTHFADNFPKRLKELHTNGGLISENESQHGQDDDAEEGAPFRDRVSLIDGEVRIARGQEGRTPLVESFATKLEADLRRIEYDRQRAGGEVLKGVSVSNEDDPLQVQRSSEGRVDAVVLSNTSSTFPLEGSEDSSSIQTDVWKKPSVLEDVIECNNMAVFYSYGATFPVTEKFASKGRGEKFEEVYPVSHHNNNNNNIKVYKPKSDSEAFRLLTTQDKSEDFIENVGVSYENRIRTNSEEELKQLIRMYVLAKRVGDVNIKCFPNNSYNINCTYIYFNGKTYQKLLIFNLVKSIMSECAAQYSHSLFMCTTYPMHLVQRKVMKLILEEEKIEHNLCGLQMFHISALHMQHEKLSARRLVKGVAAGEIKAENNPWQNFCNEEQEMKETIFSKMFHDLVSDTANVFKGLVAKKLTMSHSLED